jgi:TolB-like protein
MDSVWSNEIVNDEALTQRVMLLRRALGDQSKEPTYIASVPRWGYRIAAPVQPLGQADGATAAAVEQAPATTRRRFGAREAAVVASRSAVIALVASLPQPAVLATAITDLAGRGAVHRGPVGEPAPHIRCGLPESLTNSLSTVPDLRVVAWSSMTHFQDSAMPPMEIAESLGVASLVVGRVTEDRGMLAVMVELVDARDGRHLWGESYRRPKESLPALQEQIAAGVARTLRPAITAAELQRLNPGHTDSFEAYESYLKGR